MSINSPTNESPIYTPVNESFIYSAYNSTGSLCSLIGSKSSDSLEQSWSPIDFAKLLETSYTNDQNNDIDTNRIQETTIEAQSRSDLASLLYLDSSTVKELKLAPKHKSKDPLYRAYSESFSKVNTTGLVALESLHIQSSFLTAEEFQALPNKEMLKSLTFINTSIKGFDFSSCVNLRSITLQNLRSYSVEKELSSLQLSSVKMIRIADEALRPTQSPISMSNLLDRIPAEPEDVARKLASSFARVF
jgi:hypothetical protein